MKNITLYVIGDMLYTHKALLKENIEEDVEFAYTDLPIHHLGNRTWLISIKDHYSFEIIEETDDDSGIYRSLTVDSAHILKEATLDLFSDID